MSNVSQSILPHLSTCNFRSSHITWASAFSQQEINGGNQPFVREVFTRARPVRQLTEIKNPPKVPFIIGFWELASCPQGPVRPAQTPNHRPKSVI